ncbi:MAG TPA: CpaF family protein [Clostridia bacterium]|nr:CpaF family protein [Clostridia bacterium]
MSLLERIEKEKNGLSLKVESDETISSESKISKCQNEILKEKIQKRLMEKSKDESIDKGKIKESLTVILDDILKEEDTFVTRRQKEKIITDTINEIVGFGPITPLIRDEKITEVMVNGYENVYVERDGKIEKTTVVFRDDSHVLHIIEKIVSPLGRRIDESSPMVDARLPDGSRVNAVIHPLALDGPILTIRKFATEPYTIRNLIDFGTISPQVASFLKACVEARLNIVVSGGTGSGKTTTLNVLSCFIPEEERIVTIEDAAELQLHQEHLVRMETRPPNIEGKGQITVRDLVRNSLRMRPDRIVVGEVRTGEALDMLQAMNTGHDGSLTTGHANSSRDMLTRLETMVLMAGLEIPLPAVREQIASAIDLIVYQSRFKDGSRRITNVTEVQGMEGNVVTLQDIFAYKVQGKDDDGMIKGSLEFTGIRPKFINKLSDSGIRVQEEWFS